jgi:hypothetical protein
LRHYQDYGFVDPDTGAKKDIRVILISPTVDANPCWQSLSILDPADIHANYSDDLLTDIVDDVKAEKKATEKYRDAVKLYEKYSKVRDMDELTDAEVMAINDWDFGPPPKPRFPNGAVNILVLDDLVSTSALRPGRSALNYLAIRNRHLQINLAVLVQSMKQVPRLIRNNTSVFAIWPFKSKKVLLEDLYDEVSSTFTPAEFEELFLYCTAEQHSCMVLDFTQGKKTEVVRKSFKEIVRLK